MREMFTKEQVEKLKAKLSGDKVKTRNQAGQELSYIEGYEAIQTANDIFGFGNWDGVITKLTEVESTEIVNERTGKKGRRVAYLCIYEVTVRGQDGVCRFSDVGYGSGTSYSSLGDAIESAAKEAVTDAMKRALRNFGNQFGLALYDKEQRNVERYPEYAQVVAAYKLVPKALQDTAKQRMGEILAKYGVANLKEADGPALKEVYDYFESVAKA